MLHRHNRIAKLIKFALFFSKDSILVLIHVFVFQSMGNGINIRFKKSYNEENLRLHIRTLAYSYSNSYLFSKFLNLITYIFWFIQWTVKYQSNIQSLIKACVLKGFIIWDIYIMYVLKVSTLNKCHQFKNIHEQPNYSKVSSSERFS